jgi:hypothetical protein
MDLPLWLPVAFFTIAVVYASVGFGGGSSYLAVLAIIGLPYQVIPQTALVCNLIVSGGGVWHFRRGGHLDLRAIAPFMVLSVPAAYLGGLIPIGREMFFILLGVSLVAAGARTFMPVAGRTRRRPISTARAWALGLPTGAALGFLAGLVGIGGGIFLAPVLLLSGWTGPKQAAAAASLFIVINSAAGLVGQVSRGLHLDASVLPLAAAVLVGGQVGSRIGAYHLPARGVQRLLAALILAVGLRLVWRVV